MMDPVVIRPYRELAHNAHSQHELNAIFFSSSTQQAFASEAEKEAFRERWLGRYLEHDPQLAFAAVIPNGSIVGYIAGSADDPALAPRFSDIGYFQTFKDLTSAYPAHFHVNLAPAFRGRSIGASLVETFVTAVKRTGAPGLHVVTGRNARNVAFYQRQGFIEAGAAGTGTKPIIFLARPLSHS